MDILIAISADMKWRIIEDPKIKTGNVHFWRIFGYCHCHLVVPKDVSRNRRCKRKTE